MCAKKKDGVVSLAAVIDKHGFFRKPSAVELHKKVIKARKPLTEIFAK